MPLHMTSLVSRHSLTHPDEKPPAPAAPLDYERVLKEHLCWGRPCGGGGGKGKGGPSDRDILVEATRQRDERNKKKPKEEKDDDGPSPEAIAHLGKEEATLRHQELKEFHNKLAKKAKKFELILKYNPNHGPDGRFASSGGGRAGGTIGAPTTGAFGQKLRRGGPGSVSSRFDKGLPRGRSAEAAAFGGGASLPAQRAAAVAETYRKMRAGEGGLGYSKPAVPAGAKFSVPAGWPQPGRGRSAEAQAFSKTLEYRPARDAATSGITAGGKATPATTAGVVRQNLGPYKPAVNPATVSIRNAGRRRQVRSLFGY